MSSVRLGVYEKALPSGVSWEERLTLARRLGFHYLELSIDESEPRQARLEAGCLERREIRRAVERTGIPVASLCLSAHRSNPLGSASSETRARAVRILRDAIDLSVELGVRIVQLAGYYVYYEPETADSAQRYLEGLAVGLEHAARSGVLLGIENMDTRGITSLAAGLRVIDTLASPYLQLYPDIGNLSERGHDTLVELSLARGRMIALHVKDARPGEPRRVPFGEGAVPFEAGFAQLAADGFSGPVVIEMWNDDAPDSVQLLGAARAWVASRLVAAGFVVEGEGESA